MSAAHLRDAARLRVERIVEELESGTTSLDRIACFEAALLRSGDPPPELAAFVLDEMAERAPALLERFDALGVPWTGRAAEPGERSLSDVTLNRMLRADLVAASVGGDGIVLVLEHDGDERVIAGGMLGDPLPGAPGEPIALEELRDLLASAVRRTAARRFGVPLEAAAAIAAVAGPLGLDAEALSVAPPGVRLWTRPDDDEAAAALIDRVVADFVDWGTADDRPAIRAVARSGAHVAAGLLAVAHEETFGDLGGWDAELVGEAITGIASALSLEEARDAPVVAAELLRYLEQAGALSADPDGEQLAAAALATAPEVEAAWADRTRRSPAAALVAQMREEGVDPADPDAVAAFIADFNDRPIEERDAVLGPPLDVAAGRVRPPGPRPAKKAKRKAARRARRRNR